MDTCPVCGDLARFGVDEVIWELREVVVSACCDENLDAWLQLSAPCPVLNGSRGCSRRRVSTSETYSYLAMF